MLQFKYNTKNSIFLSFNIQVETNNVIFPDYMKSIDKILLLLVNTWDITSFCLLHNHLQAHRETI